MDFVSLDVKTTFSKYRKITGSNVGFQVKKSMELINACENVHLEARTTYVPTLHTKKDIINLADEIEADIYTIQQFRNKNVLDPALEKLKFQILMSYLNWLVKSNLILKVRLKLNLLNSVNKL